jgi:hypothetical protein
MLRTVIVLLCGLFLFGCSRPPSEAEAKRQLTGRWLLDTKHDCTYGPVESDELVLHQDGRLEQHVKLKDGRTYESQNEQWSFMPKTNVWLQSRWTFPGDAKAPYKETQSLIVEFGKEPVIVINPDSNCFYSKVQ